MDAQSKLPDLTRACQLVDDLTKSISKIKTLHGVCPSSSSTPPNASPKSFSSKKRFEEIELSEECLNYTKDFKKRRLSPKTSFTMQNTSSLPPSTGATTSSFDFLEKVTTIDKNVLSISAPNFNNLGVVFPVTGSNSSRVTSPAATSTASVCSSEPDHKILTSESKSNSPTTSNFLATTVAELLSEMSRSNSPKELKVKIAYSPANSQTSATTTSAASLRDYEAGFGASLDSSPRLHAEKRKLKQYTTEEKMDIIDFAKVIGNRAAGRQYGVAESSIREWRKNDTKLKNGLSSRFEERFPKQIAQIDLKIVNFINGKSLKDPVDWYGIHDCAHSVWLEMCRNNTVSGLFTEQDMTISMGWVARFIERNKDQVPKIAPPVIATANALNNGSAHQNMNSVVSMVRRQSTIGARQKSPITSASTANLPNLPNKSNLCATPKKSKMSAQKLTASTPNCSPVAVIALASSLQSKQSVPKILASASSSRRKCQQPRRDANATVLITPTLQPSKPTALAPTKSIGLNGVTPNKNLVNSAKFLNSFLAPDNFFSSTNIFAASTSTSSAKPPVHSTAKAVPTIAALFNILDKQNNNNNNGGIFAQNGVNSNCNNLARLFAMNAGYRQQEQLPSNIGFTNHQHQHVPNQNRNSFLMLQFLQNLMSGVAAAAAVSGGKPTV